MHKNCINKSCKRANRRTIYAGSQSVGEVRNQQLSHSLMTGLQMDEHIARIALNQGATPQVKTYLTDALGSVIATAKADQSLEVGYAFSPYGQTQKVGVENQQAGSENSSQYTGRENDGNGLYFYRARYYDAILKRFISEDPIGLAGGINSHAYVGGRPISHTDPTGLKDFTDRCVGRYENCKFGQDPNSSTVGNYITWKACEKSVDYACKSGGTYCCDQEASTCRANSLLDPIATAECTVRQAQCIMKGR
jgi:RHS repeat-associated protein